MNLYPSVLQAHGVLRWLVVFFLALRAVRGLQGWASTARYGRTDRVLSLVTLIVVDTELLLGALLYFWFSPLASAARSRAGEAMSDPILRFWLVEHPVAMLLAVAIVHFGHRRSKLGATDELRHRAGAVSALAALALVCAGYPWAFRGL